NRCARTIFVDETRCLFGAGMKINRYLIAAVACALAASVWAQSTPSPLNLSLPPNSATTATPPPPPAKDTNNAAVDATDSHRSAGCDDAAYGQPQVHGSIGMGVVAGNHVNGNYETGSVR